MSENLKNKHRVTYDSVSWKRFYKAVLYPVTYNMLAFYKANTLYVTGYKKKQPTLCIIVWGKTVLTMSLDLEVLEKFLM